MKKWAWSDERACEFLHVLSRREMCEKGIQWPRYDHYLGDGIVEPFASQNGE
jgi:hypothetical protein